MYIHGLYIDGGGWDKRNARLVEPQPKVLNVLLPIVHMYAIQVGPVDPRLYRCPVYKIPRRTDQQFITVILMRSNQAPEYWILRAVAALCDIK